MPSTCMPSNSPRPSERLSCLVGEVQHRACIVGCRPLLDLALAPTSARSTVRASEMIGTARLIASIISVLLPLGTVSASDIPHFNIEATCRAAPSLSGGIQKPYQSCLEEEKVARTQLEKVWTTHTTQQRTECVSLERVGGGSPSYVEVLTCLEMYATRSVNLGPKSRIPPQAQQRARRLRLSATRRAMPVCPRPWVAVARAPGVEQGRCYRRINSCFLIG
jgi:hypothetical protein